MVPVPNAAGGGKDYGSSLGDAALRRLTFEEGELPWMLQGLTFSLLSFANSFKGLSAWYTTLLLDWVFTPVLRKGDCVLVCKIPKANGECFLVRLLFLAVHNLLLYAKKSKVPASQGLFSTPGVSTLPGIGKLLIEELCYWNNVSKEQSQKV